MSFIGIVSNRKCFENIKEKLPKNIQDQNLKLININLKSIENIKNIKFETVIIESELNKFKMQEENLKKICQTAQYIIINTDINKEYDIIKNETTKIITYGLNQKATVTISSITNSRLLIYLQQNIPSKQEKSIEIEERRIEINEKNNLKTYEILIIYIISRIYNNSIIEEI